MLEMSYLCSNNIGCGWHAIVNRHNSKHLKKKSSSKNHRHKRIYPLSYRG